MDWGDIIWALHPFSNYLWNILDKSLHDTISHVILSHVYCTLCKWTGVTLYGHSQGTAATAAGGFIWGKQWICPGLCHGFIWSMHIVIKLHSRMNQLFSADKSACSSISSLGLMEHSSILKLFMEYM